MKGWLGGLGTAPVGGNAEVRPALARRAAVDRVIRLDSPRTVAVLDGRAFFVLTVLDQLTRDGGEDVAAAVPGGPVENTYIESFNGRLRDEGRIRSGSSRPRMQSKQLALWRRDYNAVRPHSALGDRTPDQCLPKRDLVELLQGGLVKALTDSRSSSYRRSY